MAVKTGKSLQLKVIKHIFRNLRLGSNFILSSFKQNFPCCWWVVIRTQHLSNYHSVNFSCWTIIIQIFLNF